MADRDGHGSHNLRGLREVGRVRQHVAAVLRRGRKLHHARSKGLVRVNRDVASERLNRGELRGQLGGRAQDEEVGRERGRVGVGRHDAAIFAESISAEVIVIRLQGVELGLRGLMFVEQVSNLLGHFALPTAGGFNRTELEAALGQRLAAVRSGLAFENRKGPRLVFHRGVNKDSNLFFADFLRGDIAANAVGDVFFFECGHFGTKCAHIKGRRLGRCRDGFCGHGVVVVICAADFDGSGLFLLLFRRSVGRNFVGSRCCGSGCVRLCARILGRFALGVFPISDYCRRNAQGVQNVCRDV